MKRRVRTIYESSADEIHTQRRVIKPNAEWNHIVCAIELDDVGFLIENKLYDGP